MVFGFLKRLFGKKEEEVEEGFEKEPLMEEKEQKESIEDFRMPEPTMNEFRERERFEYPSYRSREELQMYSPPQPPIEEYLKDQLTLLINKIDVLNAKLDQIIQKLNLIETYVKYR